jgi:prephenate dehydratase
LSIYLYKQGYEQCKPIIIGCHIKETGLPYKLHLFAENIEDNKSNTTVFSLFKLK